MATVGSEVRFVAPRIAAGVRKVVVVVVEGVFPAITRRLELPLQKPL